MQRATCNGPATCLPCAVAVDRDPTAAADHVGRPSPRCLSGPATTMDYCIRCQHAPFSALPSPLDHLGSPARVDLLAWSLRRPLQRDEPAVSSALAAQQAHAFAAAFPFIGIFPCSRCGVHDTFAERGWVPSNFKKVDRLLEVVIKEHGGDPTRVALTGQSMGGDGLFRYAQARRAAPQFAALVPVCARRCHRHLRPAATRTCAATMPPPLREAAAAPISGRCKLLPHASPLRHLKWSVRDHPQFSLALPAPSPPLPPPSPPATTTPVPTTTQSVPTIPKPAATISHPPPPSLI